MRSLLRTLFIAGGFIAVSSLVLGCGTGTQAVPRSQSQDPSPTASQSVSEEDAEVLSILKRLGDPIHMNLLQAAMWTLTHDYKDKETPDMILEKMMQYQAAMESWAQGDRKPLEKLGGIAGYKEYLANLLDSDDVSVRAFGAIMIGIAGDKKQAPLLVKKLEAPCDDEFRCYDRNRYAIALGLLDADDHKQVLVGMLDSDIAWDRSGAVTGIGLMKAEDAADKIAPLQNDKDEGVREAAVEMLRHMGRDDLIVPVNDRYDFLF